MFEPFDLHVDAMFPDLQWLPCMKAVRISQYFCALLLINILYVVLCNCLFPFRKRRAFRFIKLPFLNFLPGVWFG